MKTTSIAIAAILALSAAVTAEDTPTPRKPEAPPTGLVAERKARLIENVEDFQITVSLVGNYESRPAVCVFSLVRRMVPRSAVPEGLQEVVIDKAQALAIIDYLAGSGMLGRVNRLAAMGAPAGHPGVNLTFQDAKEGTLIAPFGWGTEALTELKSLRAVLKGDAGNSMDRFIEGARAAMAKALDPEREAIAKVSATRAKALKANFDAFVLRLTYFGPADKPFYWLLLSVQPQATKHKYQMEVEALIDKEAASKLIDRLAGTGVLAEALDVNLQQDLLQQPKPGPCYHVYVAAGEAGFDADLGWNKGLADHLLGLRAPLTGDAAKQMDALIGRLSGYWKDWTGKPYEPPK